MARVVQDILSLEECVFDSSSSPRGKWEHLSVHSHNDSRSIWSGVNEITVSQRGATDISKAIWKALIK